MTEKPLRVLLVSPVGQYGGGEQVLLALARHLPAFGVEPSLALLRPGPLQGIAEKQGIPVHVFEKDYQYRDLPMVWRAVGWLRALLAREKFDVVHSNLAAHLIVAPAARPNHIPEVWHMHDYPHHPDIVEKILRRIPTQFLLFTTPRVQSGYPQLAHIAQEVVFPTSVDITALRAQKAALPASSGKEARARLGLGTEPLFLTITRLQEHKGHRYLIDAAAQVVQKHPDVQWAISGKASGAEQEAYLQALKKQVAERGLEKSMHFLGFVSDEDIAALHTEATALVHPSLSEGFGLVLLEAMAVGTPIIAAASEGPQIFVRDGENGLLVPVADADGLAQAMLRVLEEPGLTDRLRAGGDAFADQQSVQTMTEKTASIYRRVVKNASS